jgi:ATP-binding cassette subfamily A (ABC1) protein 3
MSVRIPFEYCTKFEEFFCNLDQSLAEMQLLTYGISISTLEEVFLKIGHLEDPTQALAIENLDKVNENIESGNELSLDETTLDDTCWTKTKAVMIRRLQTYKRSKKSLFMQIAAPLVIFFGTIYQKQFMSNFRDPSVIQDTSRLPEPLP